MNDIESAIYGWEMRLLEIESLIITLEDKKKEYLGYIKFWKEREEQSK